MNPKPPQALKPKALESPFFSLTYPLNPKPSTSPVERTTEFSCVVFCPAYSCTQAVGDERKYTSRNSAPRHCTALKPNAEQKGLSQKGSIRCLI